MKRKTFFVLFLMFLLTSVGAIAQTMSKRTWISLADSKDVMISKNIPIYDIRVNIKSKQKDNNNVGVVFKNRDGSRYLFINTHDWKYNFDKLETKNQFKLSKSASDNDGFKHPDLTELASNVLYVNNIEPNSLYGNIQVLIKDDDAIIFYRKKAENGDVESMCFLGDYLSSKRPNEAFTWYKKAADSGNERAKIKVAECYAEGIGVEKNMTKAETMLLMLNSDLPEVKMLKLKMKLDYIVPRWNWGKHNANNIDKEIAEVNQIFQELLDLNYLPACELVLRVGGIPMRSEDYIQSAVRLYPKAPKDQRLISQHAAHFKVRGTKQAMNKIFCTEDADLITHYFSNPIISRIAQFDFERPGWEAENLKQLELGILGTSDLTHVISSIFYAFMSVPSDISIRLLNSGKCDFLWVLLLNNDVRGGVQDLNHDIYTPYFFNEHKDNDNAWDLWPFELISRALGFKFNKGQRLTKEDYNSVYKQLFFKYCDIALKPSTEKDLFVSIVGFIFKSSFRLPNTRDKESVFLDIVKADPECKKKMLEVLKKGRQLGDKLCIENYETFFLN